MKNENKAIRKLSYKKNVKIILKTSDVDEDITESIDNLCIHNGAPEKVTTMYSMSGKHVFLYSNKKTPFENACPWIDKNT